MENGSTPALGQEVTTLVQIEGFEKFMSTMEDLTAAVTKLAEAFTAHKNVVIDLKNELASVRAEVATLRGGASASDGSAGSTSGAPVAAAPSSGDQTALDNAVTVINQAADSLGNEAVAIQDAVNPPAPSTVETNAADALAPAPVDPNAAPVATDGEEASSPAEDAETPDEEAAEEAAAVQSRNAAGQFTSATDAALPAE
jgi:hypothetical protein